MLSGRSGGAVVRTRVSVPLASALVERMTNIPPASHAPKRNRRLKVISLAPPSYRNIQRFGETTSVDNDDQVGSIGDVSAQDLAIWERIAESRSSKVACSASKRRRLARPDAYVPRPTTTASARSTSRSSPNASSP